MEERLEELDEGNEDLKLDIKDAKMMISDLQTQIPVTTWQPKPKKPKRTGFPRSLLPTDGEMQVPGIHREPFTTLLKLHLLP